MKRKTIILVSIVLAVLLLWYVFVPEVGWDGSVMSRIVITVVDGQTRTPIANAAVELRRPRREKTRAGFSPDFYDKLVAKAGTDESGTATVSAAFGAGGTTGILGRSGRVVYFDTWLQVFADGYETTRSPLSRYTGSTRSVGRSQDIEIVIELAAVRHDP